MKELIVVASKAEAKVFVKKSNRLILMKTLENKMGRRRERDFHYDRPGQSFAKCFSNQAPHNLDVRTPHTEVICREFAHKIAVFLQKHRDESKFDHLLLIAEPHFLGRLNAAIIKVVKKVTIETLGKDLIKLPSQKIFSILQTRPTEKATG